MFDKAFRIAIGLVVTSIMARKMGPADFGAYYYVLSILALFQIFSVLGLDTIAARDLSRQPAARLEILNSVLTLRWMGTLFGMALCLGFGSLFAPEYLPLIAIGTVAFLSHPLDTGEFYFQSQLNVRGSMQIRAAVFFFGSLLRIYLAYSSAPLTYFLFTWATEFSFMNLFLYLRYRRHTSKGLAFGTNWLLIRSQLISAFPLIMFAFAGVVAIKMDVLFVGYFYSKVDVGIYGFAVRLVELIYVLPLAIAMSAVPILSSANTDDYRMNSNRIEELLAFSTWLGILATAGICWVVPYFIAYFYGDQYHDSIHILRIYSLVLPFVFSGAIRNYIWVAYSKEWTLSLTTLFIATILPAVYYFFVPRDNLELVAWCFVFTVITINLIMSIVDPSILKFQVLAFAPWKLVRKYLW